MIIFNQGMLLFGFSYFISHYVYTGAKVPGYVTSPERRNCQIRFGTFVYSQSRNPIENVVRYVNELNEFGIQSRTFVFEYLRAKLFLHADGYPDSLRSPAILLVCVYAR